MLLSPKSGKQNRARALKEGKKLITAAKKAAATPVAPQPKKSKKQ
jgi:gas vesicle protein